MILTDNSVSVTLKLAGQFEGTLKKLEKRLDKLDKKEVSPNFDIEGEGKLKKVEGTLKKLDAEDIRPDLDIKGKGEIASTKAQIESLGGQETVHVNIKEHRQKALRKSSLQGKQRVRKGATNADRTRDFKKQYRGLKDREHNRVNFPAGGIGGGDFDKMRQREKLRQRLNRQSLAPSRFRELNSSRQFRRRQRISKVPIDEDAATNFRRKYVKKRGGGDDDGDGGDYSLASFLRKRKSKRGDSNVTDSFLKRLVPSGKMSRQATSMIMAAVMSIIKPLAGIITAMGSTIVAGGLIGGLGLLGMGNTAPQAKKMASVRMGIMGRETFQAMKPASQHFAGFTDNIMQTLPSKLSELNGPLMGLDVFEGTIESALDGSIDFIGELLTLMADLNEQISQLTLKFGDALGSGILELFEILIKGAYQGQNAFGGMIEMFIAIINLAVQLFEIWGKTMTVLTPLFKILAKVAQILNNRYAIAALKVIVVMALFIKVMNGAAAAIMAFQAATKAGLITSMIQSIYSLAGAFVTLTSTMWGAAAAKAALFGGLALVGGIAGYAAIKQMKSASPPSGGGGGGSSFSGGGGGGFDGGGGGGSGAGNVIHHYTMNVEGDTDKYSMDRFEDLARGVASEEDEINANETKDI